MKFYNAFFEEPSEGKYLVFTKYHDFEILCWDENEKQFYDEYTDKFCGVDYALLWADLPYNECNSLIEHKNDY